jgi:hypothetical protein
MFPAASRLRADDVWIAVELALGLPNQPCLNPGDRHQLGISIDANKAASLTLEALVVDTRTLPRRGVFLGLVPLDPTEPYLLNSPKNWANGSDRLSYTPCLKRGQRYSNGGSVNLRLLFARFSL